MPVIAGSNIIKWITQGNDGCVAPVCNKGFHFQRINLVPEIVVFGKFSEHNRVKCGLRDGNKGEVDGRILAFDFAGTTEEGEEGGEEEDFFHEVGFEWLQKVLLVTFRYSCRWGIDQLSARN